MSGGSFNYLFLKDADDLLRSQEDLEAMVRRLAGLGYAEDAAREADELLLMLRQFEVRANVRMSRLYHIFRAVEWWDSGDSGEEALKETLSKYRGEDADAKDS